MGGIDHCYLARQHRAKLLQSVACTVGVGKTVAARAAIDRAEPARHHLIYIPDPTVGARGIYHHIVTALGGRPSFHNAALVPQAATRWPPNTPNGAASPSCASTLPTAIKPVHAVRLT